MPSIPTVALPSKARPPTTITTMPMSPETRATRAGTRLFPSA